ncbi:MAG TPA: hypothetical protein VFO31_16840, partial [Vicinamibacterales bacterium]|nr:hypothetical protein [Vicinamibacterales bacterium]
TRDSAYLNRCGGGLRLRGKSEARRQREPDQILRRHTERQTVQELYERATVAARSSRPPIL